jgi:MFS superfamily sulfate permease-like transporter
MEETLFVIIIIVAIIFVMLLIAGGISAAVKVSNAKKIRKMVDLEEISRSGTPRPINTHRQSQSSLSENPKEI